MSKTPCATAQVLEIGVKTLCATNVFLEIGDVCVKAKACPEHRAQLSCLLKWLSKDTTKLSFCLNLATFVKKLKLA